MAFLDKNDTRSRNFTLFVLIIRSLTQYLKKLSSSKNKHDYVFQFHAASSHFDWKEGSVENDLDDDAI